jgi:tripartite-type tricarboxylate transporter receptor subunit TctC
MRTLTRVIATAAATLACTAALAQTYPDKPIKAVVPFAAGSATDQIGRAFAQKMQEALGQPIVIDNKPGVNGMLGADAVAKAAPDGYTILIGTNSTNAALKSLMKQLPYDQDKAFAPVAYMGSVPLIMAVHPDVPAKTLKEFVDLAKAKPGAINFASASTSQLVSTEMLAGMTGIKLTNVPYKSGPAAMTDLIAGVVQMFSADFAVMLPQVKAGKVRGLAVTSTQRSPAVPELPTVNEALGIKDYELIAYFAVDDEPAPHRRFPVVRLAGGADPQRPRALCRPQPRDLRRGARHLRAHRAREVRAVQPPGGHAGTALRRRAVVLPQATKDAWDAYAESGMLSAAQDCAIGGMQLPYTVEAAATRSLPWPRSASGRACCRWATPTC